MAAHFVNLPQNLPAPRPAREMLARLEAAERAYNGELSSLADAMVTLGSWEAARGVAVVAAERGFAAAWEVVNLHRAGERR
jgi:hypothetical protein